MVNIWNMPSSVHGVDGAEPGPTIGVGSKKINKLSKAAQRRARVKQEKLKARESRETSIVTESETENEKVRKVSKGLLSMPGRITN